MNIQFRKSKKLVLLAAFLVLLFSLGFIFFDDLLIMGGPDNPDIAIPMDNPKEIAANVGGDDFSEMEFNVNQDKWEWLVPCFGAFGVDDAEDVCKGFETGYLRKYNEFSLSGKTIKEANLTIPASVEVYDGKNWSDLQYKDREKLAGDYSFLLFAIKFATAEDAKRAVMFLTLDAGYPVIAMDGAEVVGKEMSSGMAHYVIPADKVVISLVGDNASVKEMAKELIKAHKK